MKKKSRRSCPDKADGSTSTDQKESSARVGSTGVIIPISIALIVLTVSVYWQVGHHEFISYDDGVYVTKNPHVAKGMSVSGILWAFASVHGANWHPVTWLSHMADVEIYGLNPAGHHLTSVFFHVASALLLFLLFSRLTGKIWQSAFVAALFSLHPVHVESVAWVAERKDVLSAFFFFLTLLFYAEYVTRRTPALYLLSLAAFVLGLMSKPMLVTVPAVLMLLDFWPLGRYGLTDFLSRLPDLLKEKIPFFACSLLSAAITLYAQHKGGAIRALEQIPFGLRIENAITAYSRYLIKTLWPHDLSVLYPFPSSIPSWQVICSFALVAMASAAAVRFGRRHPYLPVGWFWFLITLVPVIGIVQVGRQSMADRYAYLPLIGIFVIIAWGVPDLIKGLRYRQSILTILAVIVTVASAALTWQQLGYWRDSSSLYRHTLEVTPDKTVMHDNLGLEYFSKGNLDAAIEEYRAALSINPDFASAHTNLGLAVYKKGDRDAAVKEFQAAIRLNPEDAAAHNNLGLVFADNRDLEAAITEYRAALEINPSDAAVHKNLGMAFSQKGDQDSASKEYQAALAINPEDADAHLNAGGVFFRKGDLGSAIREYRAALAINPEDADAHFNLGGVFSRQGDLEAAITEYQAVLRINPNDSDAQTNLGIAMTRKKNAR